MELVFLSPHPPNGSRIYQDDISLWMVIEQRQIVMMILLISTPEGMSTQLELICRLL